MQITYRQEYSKRPLKGGTNKDVIDPADERLPGFIIVSYLLLISMVIYDIIQFGKLEFIEENEMLIREYISSDCGQLAELFYQTVHTINAKDYTNEQLDVWATGNVDLKEWDSSFSKHYTLVAVDHDIIVGFGDIDSTGYLDRLYVHRDFQRQGIASALCDRLERGFDKITTHASIRRAIFRYASTDKKQNILWLYIINIVQITIVNYIHCVPFYL